MADVRIVRVFRVTPERLFEAITSKAEVIQWWGHDGMTFPDHQLDFSRTGPWHSEMLGQDGTRFRMEGQVTLVEAPHTVGFTWSWRYPQSMRAPESHVTFTVVPVADGAQLTVDHRGVPDDERGAQHETGWTMGPITRLERYVETLNG